jgi:hypothetical protein
VGVVAAGCGAEHRHSGLEVGALLAVAASSAAHAAPGGCEWLSLVGTLVAAWCVLDYTVCHITLYARLELLFTPRVQVCVQHSLEPCSGRGRSWCVARGGLLLQQLPVGTSTSIHAM